MGLKTLWIMRHGLAENEFESDFTRALSAVGKTQAKSVAEQILAEGELPETMLVSPFERTQETARVVHHILDLDKPFETEEMLVHFADHQLLGDYLLASEHSSLLLVSHMPIVARLTQYLVSGCEIYGYQTAQAVKIRFDEAGKASVETIYLPKINH